MRNKVISIVFILFLALLIIDSKSFAAELTVQDGDIYKIDGSYVSEVISKKDITPGTKVTVTPSYIDGYYFDYWSTENLNVKFENDIYDHEMNFVMPNEDVTIVANKVNKTEYEIISGKDSKSLDTDNFSNISDYVTHNITFQAPNIGKINEANNGSVVLPDDMKLEFLKYFEEDASTEATSFEYGKTYMVYLVIKAADSKVFENNDYIFKVSGSEVSDYRSLFLEKFPKNYLFGYVGNHFDASSYSSIKESGDYVTCSYRYINFSIILKTPNAYTVTFDSNGHGNTIDSQTIVENAKVSKPENLDCDGYDFGGWYTDKECTKEYNFDKEVVTQDITLYAKWTIEKDYTYKYLIGDNQEFVVGKVDSYTFKIDGNYNKFKSVTIGNIEFEKDVDYKVVKGSTIITFTESGVKKLNILDVGTYNVITKFTSKEVTGKLIIKDDVKVASQTSSSGTTSVGVTLYNGGDANNGNASQNGGNTVTSLGTKIVNTGDKVLKTTIPIIILVLFLNYMQLKYQRLENKKRKPRIARK